MEMFSNLFKREVDWQQCRRDFPLFNRRINSKPVIYFDNACMSLRPKQVIEKEQEYYYNYPGCAGRSNHLIAEEVEEAVNDARFRIGKFFGVNEKEVVFTKNTTEAINLVANTFPFSSEDIVLTTDKEHNSNLIPWLKMQRAGKIKHSFIDSTDTNEFSLANLEKKFAESKNKIRLVSMVFTSNLDGTTLPAKEIVRLAHRNGAKILFDCSQAAAHHEINLKKLGVDFIACSSHKMLGPNGVGALISTKENLEMLDQFLVGGETIKDSDLEGDYLAEEIPAKFEAGLQNYPGIIGFGEAIKYLQKVGLNNIKKKVTELNAQATVGLFQDLKKFHLLGPTDAEKRTSILSFVLEDKNIHETSLLLSKNHNICVRSGAHCVHSWFNQPKNKVSKFGKGTIRASFGFYNTPEEVDTFVKAVKEIGKL